MVMPNAKCKIFQSTYLGNEKDGNWDNMMRTIANGKQPFKYIDRLQIAFADIIATDPDFVHLDYKMAERVWKTTREARKQNPQIEVIAQMGWAIGLLPLFEDRSKMRTRIETFARSIVRTCKEYDLQGIDFDWEFPGEDVPKKVPEEGATYLFEKTKEYLTQFNVPIMTITPDGPTPEGQSLNIGVVNRLFDAVIPQSYNRVSYIDNYVSAGINPSILCCGICSERDRQWWPPAGVVKSDIQQYTDKVDKYKLKALYCWRVDNDDADFMAKILKYTITSSMWKYSRGADPQPPLFP
jgi:hypothetical protein